MSGTPTQLLRSFAGWWNWSQKLIKAINGIVDRDEIHEVVGYDC
jgi:hypothetical protein